MKRPIPSRSDPIQSTSRAQIYSPSSKRKSQTPPDTKEKIEKEKTPSVRQITPLIHQHKKNPTKTMMVKETWRWMWVSICESRYVYIDTIRIEKSVAVQCKINEIKNPMKPRSKLFRPAAGYLTSIPRK